LRVSEGCLRSYKQWREKFPFSGYGKYFLGREPIILPVDLSLMTSGNWLFLRCFCLIFYAVTIPLNLRVILYLFGGTKTTISFAKLESSMSCIAGQISESAVMTNALSNLFMWEWWIRYAAKFTSLCFSSWAIHVAPHFLE